MQSRNLPSSKSPTSGCHGPAVVAYVLHVDGTGEKGSLSIGGAKESADTPTRTLADSENTDFKTVVADLLTVNTVTRIV
jgi:hypothetical protein